MAQQVSCDELISSAREASDANERRALIETAINRAATLTQKVYVYMLLGADDPLLEITRSSLFEHASAEFDEVLELLTQAVAWRNDQAHWLVIALTTQLNRLNQTRLVEDGEPLLDSLNARQWSSVAELFPEGSKRRDIAIRRARRAAAQQSVSA